MRYHGSRVPRAQSGSGVASYTRAVVLLLSVDTVHQRSVLVLSFEVDRGIGIAFSVVRFVELPIVPCSVACHVAEPISHP